MQDMSRGELLIYLALVGALVVFSLWLLLKYAVSAGMRDAYERMGLWQPPKPEPAQQPAPAPEQSKVKGKPVKPVTTYVDPIPQDWKGS